MSTVCAHKGCNKGRVEKPGDPPYIEGWLCEDHAPLTERETKLLRDCMLYVDDPYGAPNHLLMVLVAKLAVMIPEEAKFEIFKQAQINKIHGFGKTKPKLTAVIGCARCGGDHNPLEYMAFTKPIVVGNQTFSHYAICPTLEEPILVEVKEDGKD